VHAGCSMRDPEIIETELMEISAIAEDTVKFERIVAWCATHPDEVPFACISSWAGVPSARRKDLRLTARILPSHSASIHDGPFGSGSGGASAAEAFVVLARRIAKQPTGHYARADSAGWRDQIITP